MPLSSRLERVRDVANMVPRIDVDIAQNISVRKVSKPKSRLVCKVYIDTCIYTNRNSKLHLPPNTSRSMSITNRGSRFLHVLGEEMLFETLKATSPSSHRSSETVELSGLDLVWSGFWTLSPASGAS